MALIDWLLCSYCHRTAAVVTIYFIICDCICENPLCSRILHSFTQMTVKCLQFYLSSIALHQNVAGSFSHQSANFCNIPFSSYKIMRFQTSKISANFACKRGGFLQRQLYLPYSTKLWQIATQIGRSATLDRRIKTVGG